MTKREEAAYMKGSATAWRFMLSECLRQLGPDDKAVRKLRRIQPMRVPIEYNQFEVNGVPIGDEWVRLGESPLDEFFGGMIVAQPKGATLHFEAKQSARGIDVRVVVVTPTPEVEPSVDPTYNHTRGDSPIYPCTICRGILLAKEKK